MKVLCKLMLWFYSTSSLQVLLSLQHVMLTNTKAFNEIISRPPQCQADSSCIAYRNRCTELPFLRTQCQGGITGVLCIQTKIHSIDGLSLCFVHA